MVEAVPAAYRGVTSYLILRDAARALAFYQQAFGAESVLRLDGPDGRSRTPKCASRAAS
jgi:PhnB protein